jgi:hypothetical protein
VNLQVSKLKIRYLKYVQNPKKKLFTIGGAKVAGGGSPFPFSLIRGFNFENINREKKIAVKILVNVRYFLKTIIILQIKKYFN